MTSTAQFHFIQLPAAVPQSMQHCGDYARMHEDDYQLWKREMYAISQREVATVDKLFAWLPRGLIRREYNCGAGKN
jgi:hypothetical protein